MPSDEVNPVDQKLDSADSLAGHRLLRVVSAAQQRFIDTLFARLTASGNDCPNFDYVNRALRMREVSTRCRNHGGKRLPELHAFARVRCIEIKPPTAQSSYS